MKDQTLNNLLTFYIAAEKLKTVLRDCHTSDIARKESTAEHSWMLSLIAITLFEHVEIKVNQLKVLKMLVVHDLAEAVTGDIPAHEISQRQTNKHQTEKEALQLLTKNISPQIQKEFIGLWEEFETNETLEAKFSQAIDKMEAVIQHNISDIKTWNQGDFDIHPFYKNHLFEFDGFIRALRDEVETMSRKKITKHNALNRLKPEFKKMYEELNKHDKK